ncbi:MAG: hypothetical protein IIC73_03310 [Armatimonadetes bacterium]|nr:hypothetical protein [Armatimonadota bacterium]
MKRRSRWSEPPAPVRLSNKRKWRTLHGFVICGPIGLVSLLALYMIDTSFNSDAQGGLLIEIPALLCTVLLLIGFVSGVIALFTQIYAKYWTAFVGVSPGVAMALILIFS